MPMVNFKMYAANGIFEMMSGTICKKNIDWSLFVAYSNPVATVGTPLKYAAIVALVFWFESVASFDNAPPFIARPTKQIIQTTPNIFSDVFLNLEPRYSLMVIRNASPANNASILSSVANKHIIISNNTDSLIRVFCLCIFRM